MFIGFVPFVVALVAAVLSLRSQSLARGAWYFTIFLMAIWGIFHGSYHFELLSTFGAW